MYIYLALTPDYPDLSVDLINDGKHIKMGHGGTLDKMASGVLGNSVTMFCVFIP